MSHKKTAIAEHRVIAASHPTYPLSPRMMTLSSVRFLADMVHLRLSDAPDQRRFSSATWTNQRSSEAVGQYQRAASPAHFWFRFAASVRQRTAARESISRGESRATVGREFVSRAAVFEAQWAVQHPP